MTAMVVRWRGSEFSKKRIHGYARETATTAGGSEPRVARNAADQPNCGGEANVGRRQQGRRGRQRGDGRGEDDSGAVKWEGGGDGVAGGKGGNKSSTGKKTTYIII